VYYASLSILDDEIISDSELRLSNAAGRSDQPSIVARDDAEIAVAWYDQRGDGVRRLLLARLSLEGTLLDTELSISDDPLKADFPVLVSTDPRRYLVTWRSGDDGEVVRAAAIGCPAP